MRLKALSIRQPWAWLIVHGHKDIENRSWNTSFRGEFLIHASAGMTPHEYIEAQQYAERRGVRDLPSFRDMQRERGGIVGRAMLVDVLSPTTRRSPHEWHERECFGYVLMDASSVPLVPMKGKLRFFEADYAP